MCFIKPQQMVSQVMSSKLSKCKLFLKSTCIFIFIKSQMIHNTYKLFKQAPPGHGSDHMHSWCLPAYLLARLPTCLPPCLLACLPACLPACLLACLPACLIACSPAYLLACLLACSLLGSLFP